jgi:hypothetical protein
MRLRALAPVVLLVVVGGVPTASHAADVHATIGTNALPMPETSTSYRLELEGTASRIATAPAPSGVMRSPDGRYGVEVGTSGVVLINERSGARRRLAPFGPDTVAYWSSKSVLAFTVRVSRIRRLIVLDPATGRLRRLASRICDVTADPWSPDGAQLALAVSLPHRPCRGVAAQPTVVGVSAPWTGPVHRMLGPPRLPRAVPLAWTRDGDGILVTGSDRMRQPVSAVLDPRSGSRRVVFGSYISLAPGGVWSRGRRFFAMPAIDGAIQSLLVVDRSLRTLVGSLLFAQQAYAWAPHRQWLACADSMGIRVFDASARHVIATIPVQAPFGFYVDSLRWARDERSVTVLAAPGLGHD